MEKEIEKTIGKAIETDMVKNMEKDISNSEIEVSVIFPTYNEAENIIPLIQRTQQALVNYSKEIIVVDDNSPDDTWKIAEDLDSSDVKVIRRLEDRGLVKSISNGIKEAKGKYVVWMDADQSMPPELIPRMLQKFDHYDIVVGSRYAKGGKDKRPLLRVVSSRFINVVTNIILNFKVLDYDSGFIIAKKEVLEKITLSDSAYGEYCIEFLYAAGKKGYKIKEVGYPFVNRMAGQSKTADTLSGLFKYGMLYLKRIVELRFKKI
jgi:dolichol-phosphate mannosyltransferase